MGIIIENDPNGFLKAIIEKLKEIYWSKIYNNVKVKPELIKTICGFLLKSEKIVLYFGKTHLAIEYFGPEQIKLEDLNSGHFLEVLLFDYIEIKPITW